jgi:hypothetical protein
MSDLLSEMSNLIKYNTKINIGCLVNIYGYHQLFQNIYCSISLVIKQ